MIAIKFENIKNIFDKYPNVIYICPIYSKQMLFDCLAKNLHFPEYFGSNWDSLEELYGDFYWLKQNSIVVFYESICKLPPHDLQTYLSIISDTMSVNNSDKFVTFIFNETERSLIEHIIWNTK